MTENRKLSKAEKAKLKKAKKDLAAKLKSGIKEEATKQKLGIKEGGLFQATKKLHDDKSFQKAKLKLTSELFQKKFSPEASKKLRKQQPKKETPPVKTKPSQPEQTTAPAKESDAPSINLSDSHGSFVIHETVSKPTAEEVFSPDAEAHPSLNPNKPVPGPVDKPKRGPVEMPASLAATFKADISTETSNPKLPKTKDELIEVKNYKKLTERLKNTEAKFKAFDELLTKDPSKSTLQRIEGGCAEAVQKIEADFELMLPKDAREHSSKQIKTILKKAAELTNKANEKLAGIAQKEKASAEKPDKPTEPSEIRKRMKP